MSDRTMLAFGRSTYSVPKSTKRVFQMALAVLITAAAILVVLSLNNVLTTQSGWRQGFNAWYSFIRRSDILGTMVLTAVVSVLSVYWTPESGNNGGKK
jgi:ABC-type sulfate transport system permease subunit